ncbi:MAG: ArsR/SmtB family transcription factor [Bacteroidota bacterium]|jgi:ArsR family transcriptional regulator
MTMTNEMPYTFHFLEASTETLRAIAHPQRLLIMDMLFHEKSLNVTEIYEKLGVEQAVASHHLRILKDRGVVQVRRDGKNSIYSLTDDRYFKIIQVLNELLPE